MFRIINLHAIILTSFAVISATTAAPLKPKGFVESEQPFLRSAVIISDEPMNRVRRGVLLPLGEGYWTCFDPDLLRYAAIWKTEPTDSPISMDSMAGISYPKEKAKATSPPKLLGNVIAQTPELPGVGLDQLPENDTRSNIVIGTKDKLGPLPVEEARYLGLTHTKDGVTLSYQVGSRLVKETNQLHPNGDIERVIQVYPGKQVIVIHLDHAQGKIAGTNTEQTISFEGNQTKLMTVKGQSGFNVISDSKRGSSLIVKNADSVTAIRVIRSFNDPSSNQNSKNLIPSKFTDLPFPDKIQVTRSDTSYSSESVVIHELSLPENNPWKRIIRPTDIAFLSNGDALLTTLDGDVWRVQGISEKAATWSRVAFGIYEPMSISISEKDHVFVLGRDQITQLVDENKDGYFENYICATDAITQTLNTRDYQTSLELEPDGSFLIGRAGLTESKKSKTEENTIQRGSVLRISADGKKNEILADGLRLPYIGRRSDGAIFASDQQGNFIPSTPIHLIPKQKSYLGFEPSNFRKISDPTPPLIWFPYDINRSASSFTILSKQGFPSLEDAFVHLSWSGRIFPIVTPKQGIPFTWKLPVNLNFPILGAATNPKNGKLYATGIGISGYKPTTPKIYGLAEISESAALINPTSLEINPETITIGFGHPLPPNRNLTAILPEIDVWNIKRSSNYGSGHYRWDGKPGKHSIKSEKPVVSADRRSLTFSTPQLFRSDIFTLHLHITDTINSKNNYKIEIYATPHHLPSPTKENLESVAKREQTGKVALVPGDKQMGETAFKNHGCVGCHSLTGEKLTGPPLNGIASRYKGDVDSFLKASILTPAAEITKGYEASMPSFEGVISDQDLLHVIDYLKSLK